MNRDAAQKIIQMMVAHTNELSASVALVHENCSPEESKKYRLAVGHILSEMQDRVLDPLLREHPDLKPDGLDYTPGPGNRLAEGGV